MAVCYVTWQEHLSTTKNEVFLDFKLLNSSIDLVISVRDLGPINELITVPNGLGESCRTRQTRPTMSRVFAITFSTARAFVGQYADNSLVCHFLRMTLSARWFYLWNGLLKIAHRWLGLYFVLQMESQSRQQALPVVCYFWRLLTFMGPCIVNVFF